MGIYWVLIYTIGYMILLGYELAFYLVLFPIFAKK